MGNPLTDRVRIGTIGELLVQMRLLQYNVQAAPPIKDSGNDLIAIKAESFRGVQVKTTAGARVSQRPLPQHYHILAIVHLRSTDDELLLDQSTVYLVPREIIDQNNGKAPVKLQEFAISASHVDEMFKQPVRS